MIDWSDDSIDWEGRGGDRGLRGIAFHDGLVYLAASDEVFVYDREFRRQGSFRNRYLKHCHEINVAGDRLYMASTGLRLRARVRPGAPDLLPRLDAPLRPVGEAREAPRSAGPGRVARRTTRPPTTDPGPPTPRTSTTSGRTRAPSTPAARRLGTIWRIPLGETPCSAERRSPPCRSAPTMPARSATGSCSTTRRAIASCTPTARAATRSSLALPTYAPEALEHADLPGDLARPNFGRGLTVVGDFDPDRRIVTGDDHRVRSRHAANGIASVNITMDVRNAVHGLEVWPFDATRSADRRRDHRQARRAPPPRPRRRPRPLRRAARADAGIGRARAGPGAAASRCPGVA